MSMLSNIVMSYLITIYPNSHEQLIKIVIIFSRSRLKMVKNHFPGLEEVMDGHFTCTIHNKLIKSEIRSSWKLFV